MFDFKTPLTFYNGAILTYRQLTRIVSQMRFDLENIPPEIGVRELIALAFQNGWILEDRHGICHIQVK